MKNILCVDKVHVCYYCKLNGFFVIHQLVRILKHVHVVLKVEVLQMFCPHNNNKCKNTCYKNNDKCAIQYN